MTAVAVAILTWRGESLTRSCLRSLRRRGGWAGPTLIVDNGSGTGEGALLCAEFGVECVTLAENGGVPAGYNAALSWARGRGLSHLLLANNDVDFTDPDFVTKLAGHTAPSVAAIGPIIRGVGGSIESAGTKLHRWIGHAERTTVPRLNEAYGVDAIDGACLLVSIDAVCRVGGLDPDFFLYWEETDWCARARAAGFRLILDPEVSVAHAGIGSGNLRQTRRYALRNSLLFVRRNIHGLPAATAALTWWFGKVPFFVARRLLEGSNPIDVLRDARWAIAFHVRDAARRGWRLPATGPDICL